MKPHTKGIYVDMGGAKKLMWMHSRYPHYFYSVKYAIQHARCLAKYDYKWSKK